MTPEEHLIKAADDLAQHGHAKYAFFTNQAAESWTTARACALGALARTDTETHIAQQSWGVLVKDVQNCPAAHKLAHHLRAKHPALFAEPPADDYDTITQYNDHPDTTGEDVILAMKQAAHDTEPT
ncbi:hypothetical protein BJP40_06585 [Streptomyces sp. CC53]|uniref:DUF6197 family protein n=1 Tax=Streptomyces sp. CC53 TaxID=1906740 RepID=UPI0008DC8586|nr:hypothetical protein [Streptomyces sp. CC53]OII61189.1 hypothetical protein BJP40_06585 [Streptomyces sp. CC53]